ncbi:hypothetical protein CEXT_307581 [Caerostris extrusa]|uniref:Uncharacterized protein n=1 Tax=Caerostris extrusa TaxID=172846 RepID=A0AAV4VQ21_CAEEX|nr:hypothetical protein CEXT_307581 [Caerostris extrusa]
MRTLSNWGEDQRLGIKWAFHVPLLSNPVKPRINMVPIRCRHPLNLHVMSFLCWVESLRVEAPRSARVRELVYVARQGLASNWELTQETISQWRHFDAGGRRPRMRLMGPQFRQLCNAIEGGTLSSQFSHLRLDCFCDVCALKFADVPEEVQQQRGLSVNAD